MEYAFTNLYMICSTCSYIPTIIINFVSCYDNSIGLIACSFDVVFVLQINKHTLKSGLRICHLQQK